MKSVQLRKLEQKLNKGKLYYVVVHGILGWGIPTAVLFCLVQQVTGVQQTLHTIARALVMFPLSGILFGLFVWLFLKRQYNKEMSFRHID